MLPFSNAPVRHRYMNVTVGQWMLHVPS